MNIHIEQIGRLFSVGPVLIVIDTRKEGVIVPPNLLGQVNLKLRISPNFTPPDLVVDEKGIGETLSFDGVWHWCFAPWSAVFAYASQEAQQHTIIAENLPPEIQQRMVLAVFAPMEPPEPKAEPRKGLRLVEH